MRIRLEAFAKVNRSLHVLGKRADGYHELDTLFETVDLADRLSFESAAGLSLEVAGDPSVPPGAENLVLRAARALQEEIGTAQGAQIHLAKSIPAGGGLGGGSSDAAATLRGLSALWSADVSAERLQLLAAGIGSDVPFFLVGGRARGRGRGEILTPLPDAPPTWFVLLVPPFGCSTPDVFRALGAAPLVPGGDPGPRDDGNDLEVPAESLRPELASLRAALLGAGATTARLSGSGSTVYGVFSSRADAERAAAVLTKLPDRTKIHVVSSISRAEAGRRTAPRRDP